MTYTRDYFISGHEGKIWAGQLVGNANIETSEDFTSIIMLKLSKMVLTIYLVQTRERGTIYTVMALRLHTIAIL